MATRTSTGTCSFCGNSYGKSGMARHLKACKARAAISGDQAATTGRRPRKISGFHLVVEGLGVPGYWMHLEVPANQQLGDLDDFLRDTWLECCGHLSAFAIEKVSYVSAPMGEFEDRGMGVALSRLLRPGMRFLHEYDFGDTTGLSLRVISEGEMAGREIRLMARNDAPALPCSECGSPSAKICSECVWDDQGLLCDECAGKHGCDEEMLLPVVNSPRTGMCAYTGESEWVEI